MNKIPLDKHYGISGLANGLLESHLVGKKQYVYFNGVESDKQYLTTDVPQGSIFGRFLFFYLCSKYVFDLSCEQLIPLFCNPDSRHVVLNNKLANRWLACIKHSLNVSKTKYMFFIYNS